VINEVGGTGGQGREGQAPRAKAAPTGNTFRLEDLETKKFPEPQLPDTEVVEPIVRVDNRGY